MIKSFRHDGLEKFFKTADKSGIRPEYVKRIRNILNMLNNAESIKDMAAPGLNLHQLKGNLEGYWAVTLTANYRIIFTFDGKNVNNIDCIDYH